MDAARGERVGDRERQLRVAAHDVVALVRLPVDREVAGLRVEPEEIHEVEGCLVGRLGSVLLVVRAVQERAERGSVPAGDVIRDPIVNGHVVEELAGVGEEVVERRVARLLHLVLENLVDRLEIRVGLVLRVGLA